MRATSPLRLVETMCCGVPEDLYDLVIVIRVRHATHRDEKVGASD